MTELLQIFAGTQSELQHELATAIVSGDCAAVRNAAHRLKGALELICAEPSGDLARALELAARQHQPETWSALLGPLQRELRRLRDALSQGE
jgi:HPt (histidine-containing phosphotransfer) domain-containing protein